jgi:chromosome segregation ATPase
MISLRKVSILAIVAVFTIGLAACSKRNTELETDYATKKASAQTLIDQINQSMTAMHTDHDQWSATLTVAVQKPGADSSLINLINADLTKHQADMAALSALVDSTKQYMNGTPEHEDSLKNADDHLGTNFTDLSDKWKSFQDAHASLQQRVQQLAVSSASAPAADTTKAAPAKKAAPVPQEHHGVVRKSAH